MVIDIHNHTSLYSECSILTPESIIRAAGNAGIDGLAFTEHDCYFNPNTAAQLEKQNKRELKIFTGTEITVQQYHVLQFGESIPNGPYESFEELFDAATGKNCAFILAHPTRWNGLFSFQTEQEVITFFKLFDAVEVRSANISPEEQEYLIELCSNHQIPMVAGSDAHTPEMCALYATEFSQSIENNLQLCEAIKSKNFRPVIL